MWQLGVAANAVAGCAFLIIAISILGPTLRDRGERSNLQRLATGLIFSVIAVSRSLRALRMLLPSFGIAEGFGGSARDALSATPTVVIDVLMACFGVFYVVLQRRQGVWMHGAGRYEDLEAQRNRHLQNLDGLVQGLVVAETALALDRDAMTEAALATTLASAQTLIEDILGDPATSPMPEAGDFRRAVPVPSHHGDADEASAVVPSGPSLGSTRTRLLVVDDSGDLRLLIRVILEADGRFDIVGEGANGAEGADLAGRVRPDVVLLDLMMPVMDGLEALPLIVSRSPNSLVIILTASANNGMTANVKQLGAAALITKTDLANQLGDHIQRLLSERDGTPTPAAAG